MSYCCLTFRQNQVIYHLLQKCKLNCINYHLYVCTLFISYYSTFIRFSTSIIFLYYTRHPSTNFILYNLPIPTLSLLCLCYFSSYYDSISRAPLITCSNTLPISGLPNFITGYSMKIILWGSLFLYYINFRRQE